MVFRKNIRYTKRATWGWRFAPTWEMSGIQLLSSQLCCTVLLRCWPPSQQPRVASVFIATGYPECLNFQCAGIYVTGMANSQSFYSLSLPAAAVFCHTNLMWSFTGDLFWKKTKLKLEGGGRPADTAFTFHSSKWQGKMCGEERSQYVELK